MRKVILSFITLIMSFLCLSVIDVYGSSSQEWIANSEVSYLRWEGEKDYIRYLDVNDLGQYAIAFSNGSNKKVYVYDSNDNFMYGYKFVSSGDIRIRLSDNNLKIYFIRSDLMMLLDSQGNCLEVKRDENLKYPTPKTKIEYDKGRYFLEGSVFNQLLCFYPKLIRYDEIGNKEIVYKTDNSARMNLVIKVFSFIVPFVIAIYLGINRAIDLYKENSSRDKKMEVSGYTYYEE